MFRWLLQEQNIPTFKLVLCGDGGTGKVRTDWLDLLWEKAWIGHLSTGSDMYDDGI